MDREQKRKQRVQLRCLKKLDKKEEKLLEERNPSLIAQKAGELTAPVREKLREKVPEKFSDGAQAAAEKSTELLEKAFEKSFEVVLEKGSRWIGKLCSEEKLREDYLQFAQKPLSSWELYKLGCKAAGRAGANMAFSSVQGGLMGALGIGLPDVPIFLGAVFKTLFEISLRFGYPYDTQPEQIYQMLLICAAVGDEAQRRQASADADRIAQEIRQKARTGEELSISREQAKKRASHALCSAALAGKLVQGTPVIGVYGGFRNGVLLRQVGSMAAVKYQQRRLREMR